MQLSVRSSSSTEKAQQDIFRVMRERRRLAEDADDDFSIMDQQELAHTISGTTRTLTALSRRWRPSACSSAASAS